MNRRPSCIISVFVLVFTKILCLGFDINLFRTYVLLDARFVVHALLRPGNLSDVRILIVVTWLTVS